MPNSKPIQAKHRERWEQLRNYGCICCRKEGLINYPEIHHLVEGYRLGHEDTIPLCPWHHRAVPPSLDMTKTAAARWLGPSLRDHKKQFIEKYGTERVLLDEVNEWLSREAGREGVKKERGQNGSSLPF